MNLNTRVRPLLLALPAGAVLAFLASGCASHGYRSTIELSREACYTSPCVVTASFDGVTDLLKDSVLAGGYAIREGNGPRSMVPELEREAMLEARRARGRTEDRIEFVIQRRKRRESGVEVWHGFRVEIRGRSYVRSGPDEFREVPPSPAVRSDVDRIVSMLASLTRH